MFAEIPPDKLLLIIPMLVLPIVPNLWAIWHVYRHDFQTPQERMVWLMAQVILPVIGGLGYLFFGKKRALRKQP